MIAFGSFEALDSHPGAVTDRDLSDILNLDHDNRIQKVQWQTAGAMCSLTSDIGVSNEAKNTKAIRAGWGEALQLLKGTSQRC